MTLDEAKARVARLGQRRLEKAAAYLDAARQYKERSASLDEVMLSAQREFLADLGVRSEHNAKVMSDDAEALKLVLDELPRTVVRPND